MYIKLTSLKDRNGQQCPMLINLQRVYGFEERYDKDFAGNPQKDKMGYPNTFTEIVTNHKVFHVAESVSEIQEILSVKDFRSGNRQTQLENPIKVSDV